MPVVTDFTAMIFDNPVFRWNNERGSGTPIIVTYSFADTAGELPSEAEFPDKIIGEFTTGFASASQQAIVRDALDLFAAAAGVRFVEVDSGGMLQFVDATSITSNGNVVSFAEVPVTTATQASLGFVVMNQAHFPLDQSSAGFRILLHEIGHAMGLDHSDDGVNTLDPTLEVVANTVMKSVGAGEIVTDLGSLDKDALNFLYGDTDAFNLDNLTIANDVANSEIDITGTAGIDRFVAPNFDTNISAGGGADIIFGSAANDEINGDDGNDTLIGGAGNDILRGGADNDTLDGLGFVTGNISTGDADQLFGGDGDDILIDRFDTTVYDGGAGNDTIDASDRSQTVIQFTDTAKFISIETVILSPGDDFFRGSAGDDTAFGAAGADTLLGEDGNDFLDGGEGADQMQGAVGDDTYVIDNAGDQIFETSGTDKVIAHIAFTLPSSIENGTAVGAGLLTGNSGANILDGDSAGNNLAGASGADIILGRDGADTLTGGADADRLNGGSGADTLIGGTGNDIYDVENVGDIVTELSGEGTDRVNTMVDFTNPANVEFFVGKFAPIGLILTGNNEVNRITGANKISSGDTINGEGGNDKLVGLVGNDTFDGGTGNDRIFGNSGDDRISGGAGSDRITGQQGADTFVFVVGNQKDSVTDFNVTEDLLDLTSLGLASATAALALASDFNGSAVFDFAGSDRLILEGVAKATIGLEDILV